MTEPNVANQSGPTVVNGLNFEKEVLESNLPVLVDVKTAWCGPCRAAAPIVHEIAETQQGKLKVVEIDGDECPDLVQRLGVRGFPTFIVFEAGTEQRRTAGLPGKGALRKFAGV